MPTTIVNVIDDFRGYYKFLSNFHYSSFAFKAEQWALEVVSPTSEHIFQAMKAAHVEDFCHIMSSDTPGIAKRRGRQCEMRPNWEAIKVDTMYAIVLSKFTQNPGLAHMLSLTGDALLIEGNTWGDRYWGMTKDEHGEWQGQNHLGQILMRVRRVIQANKEEFVTI